MNNNVKSTLLFKRYIVKDIEYRTNESFINNDDVQLEFSFSHEVIPTQENEIEVELYAHIFPAASVNNFPFEMTLCIKGFFEVEGAMAERKKFEPNAIAILFPYLRALVSTFTANSNVAPVILPAVNINAYLKTK